MADAGSSRFPKMLVVAAICCDDDIDDDDETDEDEEPGQVPPMPRVTGMQWVSDQLADNRRCLDMFRMRPNVFHALHDRLVRNYGLRSGREMCSTEALGLFLWTCGSQQPQRQATNRFEHSPGTISKRFHDVLESVVSLAADIIAPLDPTYQTVHPRLQHSRFSHFHNCIGAIDGTHIEVIVPNEERGRYYNRKGFTSQNVLAIYDFYCRFTFVCAGWPGSAHDAQILHDTMDKYGDRFPHPPRQILPGRLRLSQPVGLPSAIPQHAVPFTCLHQWYSSAGDARGFQPPALAVAQRRRACVWYVQEQMAHSTEDSDVQGSRAMQNHHSLHGVAQLYH